MITNTLMKRMTELKKDRDRLAMQVNSLVVILICPKRPFRSSRRRSI